MVSAKFVEGFYRNKQINIQFEQVQEGSGTICVSNLSLTCNNETYSKGL
jgi:hypothetical protein